MFVTARCGDCGFESCRGHGCLYLVSVVRCQVQVSAMGRTLVQSSRTECGVFVCVISKPQKSGGLGAIRAVSIKEKIIFVVFFNAVVFSLRSLKWK